MSAERLGAVLLGLMLALTACQSKRPYPDLNTVPPLLDHEAPLEERREIVRDLIEDRGLSQERQSTVRNRSGLDDVTLPTSSAITNPEDIVRDAPITADEQNEDLFESESDRAYRDRTQFDDGTLNDFIRRLKRDTAPVIEQPIPDDQDPTTNPAPKPQSWFFDTAPLATLASADWQDQAASQPIHLAGFAPAVFQNDMPVMVQFVAEESDAGFFCSYLGWMVAWSNACLDDESKGGDVTADVDNGDSGNQAETADPKEPVESDQASDSPENKAASEGSEDVDDVAGPSEDLDSSGTSPVAGTLDRLRNLIRSRARNAESSPRSRDSLAFEADELTPPEDLGAPLPKRRPKVEKDLTIVRNDRVFEFKRTPTPAFKPAPKTVIFPPEKSRAKKKTKFVPAARPALVVAQNDTVQETTEQADQVSSHAVDAATTPQSRADAGQVPSPARSNEPTLTDETKQVAKAEPSEQPATMPAFEVGSEPNDPALIDRDVIEFESGTAELPIGAESRLGSILRKAKSKGGKIFIISEAGTGSLAMERARGVGLALVRLGATADLIEYDISLERDVDRVTLDLRQNEEEPENRTAASTEDQAE